MPVVRTHILPINLKKTYSLMKLNQSIVFNKLYRSIVFIRLCWSIVFIKLYQRMVPTDKSSDVLHIQITFCKSELECSTLLLDSSISIGRIERRYESLQIYDTKILYIWQNLINKNNIYGTNITKMRNLPRDFILNWFKTSNNFG